MQYTRTNIPKNLIDSYVVLKIKIQKPIKNSISDSRLDLNHKTSANKTFSRYLILDILDQTSKPLYSENDQKKTQ